MKTPLVVASVLALVYSELAAATVTGKVTFLTRRGQRPVPAETLVWADPVGRVPRRTASTFTMTTRNKTFLPHVMAVPVGSSVSFPNEDPISHNLFSLTPGKTFDLGLYRRGPGKSQKFDTPGVVNVYCNVHPNMSAVIHVMNTPHFGFADATGAYTLDLPPGKYRLTAWNEQGGSSSTDIEVEQDGTVTGATALTLDGRSYRQVQHSNKHGQPYRAPREY